MKESHKKAKYLNYYKGAYYTTQEFNEIRAKEATKPKEKRDDIKERLVGM